MPNFQQQKTQPIISSLTEVSKQYKSSVIKVLASIILFILGYLSILAFAVLLFYLAGLLSLQILKLKAHWITLLISAGIMMTAIMFIFFVIKFLFKIKKDIDPNRIEILERDQPDLFAFIKIICEETKAPVPKSVFISPGVNACVFYNSSFLSMFFPVKKNLEIGLGLVNSLNVSEFKAVLAHEFGHFSQSSTKLGSYVYRFNKMLYNLLYDNSGWSKALQSIASVHGVLSFFANLTTSLVTFILKILIKLYDLVNLNFMALSREMEFHADLVAVSVTGSENIINALYKIEFAVTAYNYSLSTAKEFYEGNEKLPANIYQVHSQSMLYLAKENKLEIENGLPLIDTKKYSEIIIQNRVIIKDIWASHPSITERMKNVSKTDIKTEEIKISAWTLFKSKELLQEKATLKIYENDFNIGTAKIVDYNLFETFLKKKEDHIRFNPAFEDFYHNAGQTFVVPEIEDVSFISNVLSLKITDLFNKSITQRLKKYHKSAEDIIIIKQIVDGSLNVKKFDFDDTTYSRTEALTIYKQLQKENEIETAWIADHKLKISTWFYHTLKSISPQKSEDYRLLMEFRLRLFKDLEPFLEIFNNVVQFYHKLQNNEEDIYTAETKLKTFCKDFLAKKDQIIDITVPDVILKNNIMEKGYKKALFEIDVRTNIKDLDSLIPFIEDMQKLIESFQLLDDPIFKLVHDIQEDALIS